MELKFYEHWHFFSEINCCTESDANYTYILDSLETSYHKLLEKYFALVRAAIIKGLNPFERNEAFEDLIAQIDFLKVVIDNAMENSEKSA